MAKQRIKAESARPAANQEEAEQLLGEIGRLQRQAERIELRASEDAARLKTKAEQEVAPINDQIEAAFESLRLWAETNRSTLCPGNSKTAKLKTGEISWRLSPKSARITGAEEVLKALKQHKLTEAIRTKEEVDKETILKSPEKFEHIKGITISQTEDFIAKPTETQIERVLTMNKKAA